MNEVAGARAVFSTETNGTPSSADVCGRDAARQVTPASRRRETNASRREEVDEEIESRKGDERNGAKECEAMEQVDW